MAGAKVVGGGATADALQCRGALAMFTFQSLLLLRLTFKPLQQQTKLMAAKKNVQIPHWLQVWAEQPSAQLRTEQSISSCPLSWWKASTEPLIHGSAQANKYESFFPYWFHFFVRKTTPSHPTTKWKMINESNSQSCRAKQIHFCCADFTFGEHNSFWSRYLQLKVS